MKICVTSDTHGRDFEAQPADMFVHCGDMTAGGTLGETALLASWLSVSPYKHIILCPGNHDWCFQDDMEEARSLFDERVSILTNESVIIEGLTFYCNSYTPPFFDWAFMAEEDRLADMYRKSMPQEIDLLITHGPPRGILDPGYKEPHVGSTALRDAILNRKVRHHVFGHLHAAGGQERVLHGDDEDTVFHNVAACNESYQLKTQPKVIKI